MTDVRIATPADILDFWLSAGRERWYKHDAGFDAEIRSRFLATWRKAAAGELPSWETGDDGATALTIVLDQFPRNMFRNDGMTFSSDALAREVAGRAIDRGVDTRIDPLLREFLYLPFMHSEHLVDQQRCVALFSRYGGSSDNLKYARIHEDIIRRFGRFPHRNHVLGREMTAEEQAFLDAGGFSG